jgi:fumarylacetoacetate (FAA) hydrolase family protein
MDKHLHPEAALPEDHENAVLIGRVWQEGLGAVLVHVASRRDRS